MYLFKQLKPTCLQFMSALMCCAIMGQSAAVTIPYSFTAGTAATAAQVNANFTAVKTAVDTLEISNYTQFGSLNYNTITASTTFSKLATGTHTFNKTNANTKIEVTVNSRLYAGTFASASGVMFEIRVDDVASTYVGNGGAITTNGGTEFISMYAVFTGLAAGSHTVSVWARTNAGTSTGVMADPGGWGGKIIVMVVK